MRATSGLTQIGIRRPVLMSPVVERDSALGAGAGLRFGEATGLIVPRVRRDSRRIQVLEQAQNDTLAPLKTKASRRTIPIGDWVLAAVNAHLNEFGPGPHQLVMSTAYGGFVHRSGFGDMWRRARPPSFLRLSPHRSEPQPESDSGPARPRHCQREDGYLRHLFQDAEDLGSRAVDEALAPALEEQMRNRNLAGASDG
jgi:hypothetical protein